MVLASLLLVRLLRLVLLSILALPTPTPTAAAAAAAATATAAAHKVEVMVEVMAGTAKYQYTSPKKNVETRNFASLQGL